MLNCKNCNTEITFWMGLKQPTPFRFKCSECGARHRVSTPYMAEIFVGVVVLFVLLALGLVAVFVSLGPVFAAAYLLFTIGVWLALEVWTHDCISKNGKLGLLDLYVLYTRVDTLRQENRERKSHLAAITQLLIEKNVISAEELTEASHAIDAESE